MGLIVKHYYLERNINDNTNTNNNNNNLCHNNMECITKRCGQNQFTYLFGGYLDLADSDRKASSSTRKDFGPVGDDLRRLRYFRFL
jgi:hypothetical protein